MDGISQSGATPGSSLNTSTPVDATGQAFGDRQVSSTPAESTPGLSSGQQLTTPINERTASPLTAKQQLAELLNKHAPQHEQQNNRLLQTLLQSGALKEQVESDQPLTQEQIKQLEEMLPELRVMEKKGNSAENLKWRIDSQLSRSVDLSNGEQLSKLTRTNLDKFAEKIHQKSRRQS